MFEFLTALVLLILIVQVPVIDGRKKDIAVFGYLPEYRQANFDYAGYFSKGLTHLIFFSLQVNPETYFPDALDRLPSKEDMQEARTAADNVMGKLILGFGGHGRSAGFSQMTMLKSRRKKFLLALKGILDEYGLDGVDFNWEFPNTPKEWQNWGMLMQEAKLLLAPRNFVSFTMYNMEDLYDLIIGYNLISHADYVHCMAYDNRDKHSTFEFAQMGVMLARKLGDQKHKWTLGIPFYGRDMKTGEPKPFYDLVVKNLKLPQLDNSSDIVNDVFYNSQLTVYNKVIITRVAGVGGVMIWELGQDIQPYITQSDGSTTTTTSDDRSLMTAVQRALVSTELSDLMEEVSTEEKKHYEDENAAKSKQEL